MLFHYVVYKLSFSSYSSISSWIRFLIITKFVSNFTGLHLCSIKLSHAFNNTIFYFFYSISICSNFILLIRKHKTDRKTDWNIPQNVKCETNSSGQVQTGIFAIKLKEMNEN